MILTYDIVQESYDNCGDYSKSKYQDIVSERFYKSMNYLHESERGKVEAENTNIEGWYVIAK